MYGYINTVNVVNNIRIRRGDAYIGTLLYSEISNPLDRTKRYSPGSHSSAKSSSWRFRQAAITADFSFTFPPLYIARYPVTAQLGDRGVEEVSKFRNCSKIIRNTGSLDWVTMYGRGATILAMHRNDVTMRYYRWLSSIVHWTVRR